jgi:hypothetical protein
MTKPDECVLQVSVGDSFRWKEVLKPPTGKLVLVPPGEGTVLVVGSYRYIEVLEAARCQWPDRVRVYLI